MAITQTLERRRLIITLGENEAPSHWQWECVAFIRDDGVDVVAPSTKYVDCTAEEAAAHIGQAALDQLAVIEAKDRRILALAADLEAERVARREDAAAAAAAAAAAQARVDALSAEIEALRA